MEERMKAFGEQCAQQEEPQLAQPQPV
jgi:hypothetical protein